MFQLGADVEERGLFSLLVRTVMIGNLIITSEFTNSILMLHCLFIPTFYSIEEN